METKKKFKKWHIVLLSIVALLVVFRLFLPLIVKNYVNKVLADMKGYKGHVEDIDISLWRGAYVINELKIDKVTGKVPVPFLYTKAIDLSVEWEALFDGGVKAKVIFLEPVLTFVAGPTKETTQTGTENDWTESLDKLVPIEINRFEIHKGKIKYNDFYAKPKVDIFINEFELVATNLTNLINKSRKLPSDVTISGSSIGGGHLSVIGKMNIVKKVPDADMNLKFTNINLVALNDFAMAYGKFDFEEGTLSIFSEMSMNNGDIDGYVKPILEKVDVVDWKNEEGNFVQKLWQVAVGATFEVFKNHSKDRFATKVPIKTEGGKVQTDIIRTVLRVLKNAFIEAYDKTLDNSVSYPNGEEKPKKKKFLFF